MSAGLKSDGDDDGFSAAIKTKELADGNKMEGEQNQKKKKKKINERKLITRQERRRI